VYVGESESAVADGVMGDVIAMRWEREWVAGEVAEEHVGGGVDVCSKGRVPCVEGGWGGEVGAVEDVHAEKVGDGERSGVFKDGADGLGVIKASGEALNGRVVGGGGGGKEGKGMGGGADGLSEEASAVS
jgi:hypothetical protein